jgi:predicted Fe-S protein YdhL (DUF1289 family)
MLQWRDHIILGLKDLINIMVESPCTSVCDINPENGLCKGCRRTKEEIFGWLRYSDADKKQVLLTINRRKIENT